MADFPVPRWPVLNVITPFHTESLGINLRSSQTGYAGVSSGVAPAANHICYYPFLLYETATVYAMSYIVGGTANGNVDLGVYDAGNNLLVSTGSTGQGTINVLQEIDVTDTVLAPGQYFMAIQLSSATGTYYRTVPADEASQSLYPLYSESPGGFGLPAAGTLANTTIATPPIVAMGVHFDSLI